jgi:outer membrane protein assembly factor BamB
MITAVAATVLAVPGVSAAVASPPARQAQAPAMKINSVSPAKTAAGKSIIITGTKLSKVSRVQVHSTRLAFHVISATRITAKVPAGATTGLLKVIAATAQATSPKPLLIAATVTSISPTSGGLNTTVTVNGTGFTAPATVSFHGASTTATVVSATKLTALVPAGSSTGAVTVKSAGSTVSAGTFTVTTSVALSSNSGPPTSTVTISGAGFGPSELVDLYYGLTDVALVATAATGTFSYSGFTIPQSAQPGAGWISAQGRHSGFGAQGSYLVRTNWTQLGYKASGGRNNAYENTLSPSNVGGLGQAWAYTPGTSVTSSITVSGGLAYVMSTGSGLSAVDATTGAVKWTYAAAGGGYTTPNVTNGIVYVGSSAGTIYALTATTGALKWSLSVGAGLSASPVVSAGIVYIGSYNGSVYALNATTGAIVWSYATPSSIYSSTVVSDGIVYFGSNDNYIYALNAATGALLWRYLTGSIVEGVPAVVNGVVYIGSDDAKVYALNARTGAVVWINTLGATMYGAPAVANGLVYVGASNSHVYALNANTGSIVWNATTSGLVGSSVAYANGVVYAANYSNQLYALDGSYGGTLWTYTAGDTFFFTGPTVVNGTVYIGSNDGRVRAFTLAGGLNPLSTARPGLRQLHADRTLRATR